MNKVGKYLKGWSRSISESILTNFFRWNWGNARKLQSGHSTERQTYQLDTQRTETIFFTVQLNCSDSLIWRIRTGTVEKPRKLSSELPKIESCTLRIYQEERAQVTCPASFILHIVSRTEEILGNPSEKYIQILIFELDAFTIETSSVKARLTSYGSFTLEI